jgi:hypothetical protein
MITTKLKLILTAAGCTAVLYESDKLANILVDTAAREEIIGLILQPNSILKNIKANSIQSHYKPTIEIIQQVKLEDTAENNEAKLQSLELICEAVILELIATGYFKHITGEWELIKILETRYDANVIGWSMPLDLYYLLNENKC